MNLYKTFVVPPLGPLGGMVVSRLKPNIAQTRLRFPSFVSDKALAVGSLPCQYRRLAPCRSCGLNSIGLKPVLRTCYRRSTQNPITRRVTNYTFCSKRLKSETQ